MCDGAGVSEGSLTAPADIDDPHGGWRKRSKEMSLDPLLYAARFLSSQEEVRRSAVGFIGYGATQPGDRVLVLVDTEYDHRIPDAVAHALRERGAKVDILVWDAGPEREFDEVTELEAIIRREPLRMNPRRWDNEHPAIPPLHKTIDYDLIIHGKGGPIPTPIDWGYNADDFPERFEGIPWLNEELFTSDVTDFPRDVHALINWKTWNMIWKGARNARVHVTDPEGTDVSWTLPMGYFDATRRSFRDTPHWGHLNAHPSEPILPEEDAEGVFAATTNHFSAPFPRIELEVSGGYLQEIRGGGAYGDAWCALEQETRGIQYPGHPRPGLFFLCETALGTHPKVARPKDIRRLSSGGFEVERRRSGFTHIGLGTMWRTKSEYWAGEQGLPYGHLHVHLQMPTIRIDGPQGEYTLVEEGRLTALDDPEVRDVASRHGDPDNILAETWQPTIPGVNAEGSYDEYAKNPRPHYYGE